MTLPTWTDSGAHFPDPFHRVWLMRRLPGKGPRVAFIGHNPSRAGESSDDATSRRVHGFANAWAASAVAMVNISTYIATKATEIDPARSPFMSALEGIEIAREWIGPDGVLIAAWGAPKVRAYLRDTVLEHMQRVARMYRPRVLRLTPSGYPEHPLYLPKCLVPIPWEGVT